MKCWIFLLLIFLNKRILRNNKSFIDILNIFVSIMYIFYHLFYWTCHKSIVFNFLSYWEDYWLWSFKITNFLSLDYLCVMNLDFILYFCFLFNLLFEYFSHFNDCFVFHLISIFEVIFKSLIQFCSFLLKFF